MDKIEKVSHYMSVLPVLQQITGVVEMISAIFLAALSLSSAGLEEVLVQLKVKKEISIEKLDNATKNLIKSKEVFFRGLSHVIPIYGTYYSIKCLTK